MYNNWLQKLTESYVESKVELTESEMILEELNETKEYAYILEHVLNTLLEHEVINEEIIMEALSPFERIKQAKRMGLSDKEGSKRYGDRLIRLNKVASRRDELQNDPSTIRTGTLSNAHWLQADDILRGSDYFTEPNVSTIDRRVPPGSHEESDIVDTGLRRAGVNSLSPAFKRAQQDATDSIRRHRSASKSYIAKGKREARAKQQG